MRKSAFASHLQVEFVARVPERFVEIGKSGIGELCDTSAEGPGLRLNPQTGRCFDHLGAITVMREGELAAGKRDSVDLDAVQPPGQHGIQRHSPGRNVGLQTQA